MAYFVTFLEALKNNNFKIPGGRGGAEIIGCAQHDERQTVQFFSHYFWITQIRAGGEG